MANNEAQQAVKEKIYGLYRQAAFGTAIAGTVDMATADAHGQLDCEPFAINPDMKTVDNSQSVGSRKPRASSKIIHGNGAAPKFSVNYNPMPDNFDLMMLAVFQNGVEGDTTPFDKTFTFGDTQPNFSADAGYVFTVYVVDPATGSYTQQVVDAISNKLTLTLESGQPMKATQEFISRGLPSYVQPTPTGAWSRANAKEMFFVELMDRCTVDFGSGAVNFHLKKMTLNFWWDTVELIGQDGSGNFATYGLIDPKADCELTVIKDSDWHTALSTFTGSPDTEIDLNVGWGNATPGTVDNDLDFQMHGKLIDCPENQDPILSGTLKVDLCDDDAGTTEMVTVVMANTVDRTI